MNPTLLLCLSSSDSEEEESCLIRLRKEIRDKSDPLSLPTIAFKTRFRLTKEAFCYVLDQLEFIGHMSTAVPPKIQLAATLSLLASGSFQHAVGNDYLVGLGQSIVSKIVSHVTQGTVDPTVYWQQPFLGHNLTRYFLPTAGAQP